MEQILPGVWHWTAYHEGIRTHVHSNFLAGPRALVDPMLPEGGIGAVEPPERILLTNRHHYRHAGAFVEEHGCPVLCHEAGLHEFENGPAVEGFAFGDEVAPGVTALEVGAICPEETALFFPEAGLIAFADGVIRVGGELAFVPDYLLGNDPEGVKQGLRAAFLRICADHEFDNLLLAHGEPLVGGGRAALSAFSE